jgi:hypothetical protein
MEHSIHLAAGHFITTVSPTSSRRLFNKIQKAFKKAQRSDNVDVDDEIPELVEDNSDGGDGDEEDMTQFDLSDTIGKALALVKQVFGFSS